MTGSSRSRARMTVSDYANYIILAIIGLVMLYPFLYVVVNSVSDVGAVANREVFLLPKGFSLAAYEAVFKANSIVRAYLNSIFYTLIGTAATVGIAVLAGYVLSEPRFRWRAAIGWILSLTLFIEAGLIPTFTVYAAYGLVNSPFAMVVPWAFTFFSILLVRTYIQGIPQELKDAARVDGASDIGIIVRVIVPLSLSVIAVVALITAVDIWNSFFTPFIYLNKSEMQPLPIILQRVLVQGGAAEIAGGTSLNSARDLGFLRQVQMASIIVTVVPILLVYPFVQRFFVKGVLIGSVKG